MVARQTGVFPSSMSTITKSGAARRSLTSDNAVRATTPSGIDTTDTIIALTQDDSAARKAGHHGFPFAARAEFRGQGDATQPLRPCKPTGRTLPLDAA